MGSTRTSIRCPVRRTVVTDDGEAALTITSRATLPCPSTGKPQLQDRAVVKRAAPGTVVGEGVEQSVLVRSAVAGCSTKTAMSSPTGRRTRENVH